jgi:dTDP-4-dehydrorhamnose 3,5-epimerase-like enzyme
MSLIKILNFEEFGDSRGGLIALEGNQNIPFEMKRVYYIYNTSEGASRGFHAHKELYQVAICISGSCRFVLDDGNVREDVVLNKKYEGLLIKKMLWREMYDFSEDCVLMVLASAHYDESDYIRDYSEFLKEARVV